MKDKVVTEDNYKKIVLERMIVICWIILLACFLVKIFGGNFFNIIVHDKKFISFCIYVDNSFILYSIIGALFNMILSLLFILAIDSKIKPNKFQFVYITIISILISVFKVLFIRIGISWANNILDVAHILSFIFIVKRKQNLICSIVQYMIFMIISNFIKGFSLNLNNESVLITMIMSIDVFIMLTLMYLYSNKKGDIFMGVLFIFLSKDAQQLQAYKEIVTKKYEKKIAKIDKKIEQAEAKARVKASK